MMRMLVVYIFVTLAALSSAQVIGFGGCPDVRPVDDFNFTRYTGRWYEIARFFYAPEEGVRCQSVNYTMRDGYLIANDTGLDANGRAYSFQVPIRRATDENSGRLYYVSEEGPGEFIMAFVDYENYAMIHVCTEYLWGFINVQTNWIVARQRRMSEEDFDEALRYLTSMGINAMKFKKADQENCPF